MRGGGVGGAAEARGQHRQRRQHPAGWRRWGHRGWWRWGHRGWWPRRWRRLHAWCGRRAPWYRRAAGVLRCPPVGRAEVVGGELRPWRSSVGQNPRAGSCPMESDAGPMAARRPRPGHLDMAQRARDWYEMKSSPPACVWRSGRAVSCGRSAAPPGPPAHTGQAAGCPGRAGPARSMAPVLRPHRHRRICPTVSTCERRQSSDGPQAVPRWVQRHYALPPPPPSLPPRPCGRLRCAARVPSLRAVLLVRAHL